MNELLRSAQMAEADRLTIAGGVSGFALMQAAGRAVAEAAGALLAPRGRVTVVCGPGNNGGDGFVAARLLADRGWQIRVLLAGDREKLRGDAGAAARFWGGEVAAATPDGLRGATLIVDAMFGAGLARPVEGVPRALVDAMNEAGAPVLAVDLPSGINGDSGEVMGAAVRASETLTFFRRKPGHLLLPGRAHCGRVRVADIGIASSVLEQIRPRTFANTPELWGGAFPWPAADGHKYSRGHAVVLSGGLASTGAGRLAARAALRAGAGLVTIASPREALAVNAAASMAVMVRPVDGADELAALLKDRRLNAAVLGPGGGVGEAMRRAVQAALEAGMAVVLDADALTSFEGRLSELAAMIRAAAGKVVLTPHAGEFTRLFQNSAQDIVKTSKFDRVHAAATVAGAIVLLKGADTVVAHPDGRAAIADNAPPWLATAGAGDVLSGIIAGLLAQGMPPFEAASAGVWLHGEAAARCGPGLISEDLPEMLPGAMKRLLRPQ